MYDSYDNFYHYSLLVKKKKYNEQVLTLKNYTFHDYL